MKKIITLLAVIGMFGFQSCEGPEGPPGIPGNPGQDGQDGLIAEVFELNDVSFVNDPLDSPDMGYFIYRKLEPKILDSDQILIYRLAGTIDAATPIWQSIPRTLFLQQGELDYDFDFSKEDFTIYAGGTYNLSLTPEFLNNQTFRIVIIPGYFSTTVDKSNYNAVVRELNINESQIQKIEVQ
ncbi:hypothetical protein [Flavobacterium granuli]|uniref:Collagen triple helix repeat-containing protein n=1 Tax=Flavobacterium granuli TaxID=280093 RepID=A0ABU1RY80_9FLAO|nr:hypothetical protein [Flavobacterium granuli]MDR6843706.1 hypothetical protein [Flavobacterium granuli]